MTPLKTQSVPRIPAYRLHKPSGLAVVRLNGRDVYLGPHGSAESHTAYRKAVAEWLACPLKSAAAGSRKPRQLFSSGSSPTLLTVNELVLAYLDFSKTYYVRDGVPTREIVNIKYAVRLLVELYGGSGVSDFGPLWLKAVRQMMIEQDWCRGIVNARVNLIRRVFKWGVENELVPPSVFHGLQAVAGLKRGRCSVRDSEPVKPVDDHVIVATCAAAPKHIAAMIQLQRLTGMRPGELVIMRLRDIDRSSAIWRYTPPEHKTQHHGKIRTIYLGPAAQRILRPILKPDQSAFIFTPQESLTEIARTRRLQRKTPVQPSQVERQCRARPRELRDRYTTMTYARAIAYACDKAFPHPALSFTRQSCLTAAQLVDLRNWRRSHRWSPNRLRHSAATQLRKQFGIEAARVVLGHSSAGVTEIYAEQDLARAADIMGKVG